MFSLVSEKQSDDSYKLFLVLDPIATFWNPFNVTYSIPRSGFNAIKFWGMPYSLNLKVGGNNIVHQMSNTTGSGTADALTVRNYTHLQIGSTQNFVMRPGEVQVISQGSGSSLVNFSATNETVEGRLGWDNASGIKIEVKVPTVGGVPQFKIAGSDKLTYSITANEAVASGTITHVNHAVGNGRTGETAINTYVGVFKVSNTADAGGGQVNGKQMPWVFPDLPELGTYNRLVSDIDVSSGSNVSSKKWPIVALSHGVRTEFDSSFTSDYPGTRHTSKPFLHMNPKVRDYDLGQAKKETLAMMPTQIGIRRPGGGGGSAVDLTGTGLGYYGGDFSSKYGTSYIVTHSIPFAPIFSLGPFRTLLPTDKLISGRRVPGCSIPPSPMPSEIPLPRQSWQKTI